MKGDMEKCIAAGANDYLSSRLISERLFFTAKSLVVR